MNCAAARMLLLAASLVAAAGAHAQSSEALRLSPAPADASAPEVLRWVLAPQVEGWVRVGEVITDRVREHPALANVQDKLTMYRFQCGASATYEDTDGQRRAEVLLLAFDSELDALGFFAAQRGPEAVRVLLTALAYRDRGVLHAQSGRYYLRVRATGPPTAALQPDQHLAARLEEGLPPVIERPRMLAFFPRKWLTALVVSYGPAPLLGAASPMVLRVSRDLPLQRVEIAVADVGSEAAALALYTRVLESTMASVRTFEVPRLGQEAFACRTGRCPVMVMRQDEFLGWVCGDSAAHDAEPLLRLLGTAIRTSRPLPAPPTTATDATG